MDLREAPFTSAFLEWVNSERPSTIVSIFFCICICICVIIILFCLCTSIWFWIVLHQLFRYLQTVLCGLYLLLIDLNYKAVFQVDSYLFLFLSFLPALLLFTGNHFFPLMCCIIFIHISLRLEQVTYVDWAGKEEDKIFVRQGEKSACLRPRNSFQISFLCYCIIFHEYFNLL